MDHWPKTFGLFLSVDFSSQIGDDGGLIRVTANFQVFQRSLAIVENICILKGHTSFQLVVMIVTSYFSSPSDLCERLISGLEFCINIDEIEIGEDIDILYSVSGLFSFKFLKKWIRCWKRGYFIMECFKTSII
jgi:hypothetical protein